MKYRILLSILLSLIINFIFAIFLFDLIDFDFEKKKQDIKIPIKLRYSELKNDLPNNEQTPPPTPLAKNIDKKETTKQQQIVQKPKPIKKDEKPKEIVKKQETKKVEKKKDIDIQKQKPIIAQEKKDEKVEPKEIPIQEPNEPKEPTKEYDGLSSFLKQVKDSKPSPKEDAIDRQLQQLYSKKELSELSNTQKKFLREKLDEITKWTQYYLTKLGYPSVARSMRAGGVNIVQCYLYPDGYISDILVLQSTGYKSLDDNTKFVIDVAHRMYPKPREKTLIRFYVHYINN